MSRTNDSPELPRTPAGVQLAWYLDRITPSAQGASDADSDRFSNSCHKRWAVSGNDVSGQWRRLSAEVAPVHIDSIEVSEPLKLTVQVTGRSDKRWRVTLAVEAIEPHRITRLAWDRVFEFEVTVREATEADGPDLAEIERQCPLVLDDATVTFDRGDDYFAFARLMEDVTVGMGFVDGVPAAINCGAAHDVLIGGERRRIMTAIHTRVLPQYQGKGLWGAVSRLLGDRYAQPLTAGSQGFVSVNNTAMQKGFANTPNKWPTQALRCQINTNSLAGTEIGRPASPADGPLIAELLNAFHGGEEMYIPYTVESLVARLERAPRQYSWDRVWLTDNAIVGVWPAGESIRVLIDEKGVPTESRRGLVLDYGFVPGAEGEFESLLRAWCGWLAGRDFDTLSIFTSEQSHGYDLLRRLATEIDAFDMWTPGIEAPGGADKSGLYVDQIYF